ncbi:MAG: antibiotic biosynthesis monooxygenase family protein [Acidimicrobiales bacterium]
MIIEHAWLEVSAGREAQYEAAIATALPIIESAPGCGGAEVRRQIEAPSTYLLLVQWSSVEAHLDFRTTNLFAQWRELTHPFYSTPPTVTHFAEPVARD